VSVFDAPETLVLRTLPDGRRTAAAVGTMKTDGGEVAFVRVGVQFCTSEGEWRWSKGEGVTVPLRKLGALAAWLIDAGRAIPRSDESSGNGKGWAK